MIFILVFFSFGRKEGRKIGLGWADGVHWDFSIWGYCFFFFPWVPRKGRGWRFGFGFSFPLLLLLLHSSL